MVAKRILLQIVLFTTLAILSPSAVQSVQVYLGDQLVSNTQIAPVIVSGETLVPIRPLVDILGGDIAWDSYNKILTVTSDKGKSTLRIGRRDGLVLGKKVLFARPPILFGGYAFAPILFFTDMFQTAVIWDPVQQRIRLEPVFPGRYAPPRILYPPPGVAQPPSAKPQPGMQTVRGTAIRVIPSPGNPRITIRTQGRNVTFTVARNAVIVRGALGQRGIEVTLGEIRPGDQVVLTLDERKVVRSIRAKYQEIRGRVQSIGTSSIMLDTGRTLAISEDTQILLPEDITGELSDLRLGDLIIASIIPGSNEALAIRVVSQPEPPNPNSEAALSLNTTGPLKEGDTLVITFLAYPGGTATYTIPGLAENVPMTETSPGVYAGEYNVKQGDVLQGAKVTVRFIDPQGRSYSVTSRRPISIVTSGGYLPRITYPSQGQQVRSPLVVEGFAQPGAIVRVTVGYYQNLLGSLPLQGITAVEDVVADADGRFRTSPLPITVPWEGAEENIPFDKGWDYGQLSSFYRLPEHPLVYTITASVLNEKGEEAAAYTVTVRKQPGR
ncbi:MAG: copper amine oxidase N-terminal domain-containing protein [Armatimonadetes bacterium]|nr:copper amine oxidase N-terminal domain-containing protein [Armatimonadota bacterium]